MNYDTRHVLFILWQKLCETYLKSTLANQSLKLTEPAVDDFARALWDD